MLENINFEDSGERVSVTIDNESIELPINKINRLPTYISLNQSLNTALENNIELNASIYYPSNTKAVAIGQGHQIDIQVHVQDENKHSIANQNVNIFADTDVAHDITSPQTIDLKFIDTEHEDETEVIEQSDDNHYTEYLTSINDSSSKLNIDGSVTVTIYNNDNSIYYVKDVHFIKGNIIDSIKNTLPLGTYVMVIEYAGNKYFKPSTLRINFAVEKRLSKCILTKEIYYGDFEENLHISGTLIDNERNTAINNCLLNYDFNGETKTISTNNNGEFSFNVTVPTPDIEHCIAFYDDIDEPNLPGELYQDEPEEEIPQDSADNVYYEKDEDGNIVVKKYSDNEETINSNETYTETNSSEIEYYEEAPNIIAYYPNASYIIDLYTDNDSYYLNDTEIEIIANKAPVSITATSTNSNTISNIIDIAGSALAHYNNRDNDVQYGKIIISFPDVNYEHSPIDIENGVFSTSIDLIDVYSAYNQNDIEDIEVEDTTYSIDTSIEIIASDSDIYNDKTQKYVNIGDSFTVKAKVSAGPFGDVPYGALLFSLMNEQKEIIYQYITEVDRTGIGVLNFNTSKEADYFIKVEYLEIFGYKHSESSGKDIVRVKNVI